jgi:hypothetical protein
MTSLGWKAQGVLCMCVCVCVCVCVCAFNTTNGRHFLLINRKLNDTLLRELCCHYFYFDITTSTCPQAQKTRTKNMCMILSITNYYQQLFNFDNYPMIKLTK